MTEINLIIEVKNVSFQHRCHICIVICHQMIKFERPIAQDYDDNCKGHKSTCHSVHNILTIEVKGGQRLSN